MPATAKSLPPEKPAQPAAPGTGPSPVQRALRKLGLVRDIDFALYLPMRYEDETRIVRLADTCDGDLAQIEAVVTESEVVFRPRRQLIVTVDDGSDTCQLRFFNFYPSQQKQLAVGARVRVRGEVRGGFVGRQMMHPNVKAAGTELPQALTPVYSTIAGLPQPVLRREVRSGLARAALDETVPAACAPDGAWELRRALHFLHYPAPDVAMATLEDHSHPAWQRLKADELLAQQLSQLQARRARSAQRAPMLQAVASKDSLGEALRAVLPFALTGAQQRVVEEIARDLAREVPMHRLLQGDVGSGKTVVAALAAARCIDAGYQCALMAPTEILAAQHFGKLVGWLDPLLAERGLRVAWLTGSQKKKERDAMSAAAENGEAALVIGTHAVISEKVRFRRLALAIIDEQHRFGVAQRLALRGKAGGQLEPHLLMMSATPIPRTLAMSYYADLDVSTLDELPPGRTPIVTKLVAEHRRDEVVDRIRVQLEQGRQVYWVCPLIEESEAVDLRNATETRDELASALGDQVGVGLLHSRMPTAEKQAVMESFTANRLQVLVSTTVIEVGVDVPNASLMVIEHAERFGLSQLHQLRGRVGRGAAASACVLLYAPNEGGRVGEAARARLKAMAETSDGFEIARRDLGIRGPGEFLGARQSGAPLLRFADLSTDLLLLDWARALAPRMLDRHPELAERHVDRWLGSKAEYLKA
ncbi:MULTISPECIES: ATP-dependent DNA helicase RecG [unclassified Variovorax]|uniref:ATP-dependent DNA helicase RecG n=1 Tax=unclassified Variovorax TaxID=663243 RepID=UPI00076D67A3|nr:MULTISPECIES: ATP-dependent DNA helicase RecG [unclassified Variovorax]KWT97865.1 ATP-dependent DNA helicase RecG [Variovorax sp. WDL1]PNG59298.1 ATP-dependent DNA helicase RecG [Variovorax sp. B4]PNG60911.1 ATP-dependent DNA helicase RecG [Variovorax sp. B2]VTV13162.1 ATP-dependent DNA helicase RecG [Variovorax sp. WDL1]